MIRMKSLIVVSCIFIFKNFSKFIHMAVSQTCRLSQVTGVNGRKNDIIFCGHNQGEKEIIVFFGGDTQDYKENMECHKENYQYSKWHLEFVAELLHHHFPQSMVFVVKPSRMYLKTFSGYDNFMKCNAIGVPDYSPDFGAYEHLEALLQNAYLQARESKCLQSYQSKTENPQDYLPSNIPISLIGFSKGCVVLNQLLYELQRIKSQKESSRFLNQTKCFYWLDGGHAGGSNTWVTDKNILRNLRDLNCEIHVHVTPYQINDVRRLWIQKEEKIFSDTLKQLGANIFRYVHFANESASIENHFKIIEQFRSVY